MTMADGSGVVLFIPVDSDWNLNMTELLLEVFMNQNDFFLSS